jgi:prophage DNA circulation protein
VCGQDLSNAVLLVFANKQDLRINGDPRASGSSAAAGSSASAAAASAAAAAPAAASSSSSSSISAASAAAADAAAASFSSCLSAAEIADYLNLQAIKDHSWHIQACCALTGEGLYEGIEWVTQAVTKA